MADVFISYSKADHEIAKALADDLVAAGVEVWWDFRLYAGDDFHDMIRAEIAKAKAVIVIWSEAAVASQWVRGEAVEAFEHGTLIPTHVPNFDPRRVPINFKTMHCEPVSNRERVIAAVTRKVAKPQFNSTQVAILSEDTHNRQEGGDVEALVELGKALFLGTDAPMDQLRATTLFEKAAANGSAEAEAWLGLSYEDNIGGRPKDEYLASLHYASAAGRGVAWARTRLASHYLNGTLGLRQDEVEAARLYGLSAEQGDADAQCKLGTMYEKGHGVPKDERKAAELFRKAADSGFPRGQLFLADYYENGRGGTRRDVGAAIHYYRLAAAQGNIRAAKDLKRLGVT